MPNTTHHSKLLALLDAASAPDPPASDDFADVSPELQTRLRQYASDTLQLNRREADAEEQEERLVEGISQEPRGLLLLRSLLNDVAAVEELGPVPGEIIQRQMRQLQRESSNPPADFTVVLSHGRLRYAGERPKRTTQSFELARDPGEATTLLQHTQRLNHCEVKVAVEAGNRQTFSIVLEFTYIDPRFTSQPLTVSVADDTAAVALKEPVTNNAVEFEDLPAGSYTIQISDAQTVIDQFRAELQLDKGIRP